MKSIILPGLALLFSGILMLMHLIGQTPVPQPTSLFQSKPLNASFALVELFTSQGCSSCPPADRVLLEIGKEAEKKGQSVYTLSFHVDYWNYLGWKDPYSDSRFSDRQRQYSEALPTSVYTPQMVVNGQVAFVGSRQLEAERHIRQALTTPASASIKLSLSIDEGEDFIQASYELSTVDKNWVLQVALVEDELSDKVLRGENRNRTLTHHHVVRAFSSEPLSETMGSLKISTEGIADLSEAKLIAYIQERGSLRIIGAEQVGLGEL